MNNPTIRLLILNDSSSEAERLISMLKNAGRQTRAQHVESEEALAKLLQSQSWDLLIGLDTTSNITPDEAIKQIRRNNKDLPVILLTDEEGSRPIIEGMKLGASDVIRLDEDQHLLHVITRELDNRTSRSQARFAERRFKEIERRNQQLLDSSRDAISFVQDGMFIYANESFAELLEYDSRDELECMPVIDVVEESDQNEVKVFLKDFVVKGSEIDSRQLSVKFLTANEEIKQVSAEVTKANYDDEACLQLLVPGTSFSSRNIPATNTPKVAPAVDTNIDPVTDLYSKAYFIRALEKAVDAAMTHDHTGAVMYISIQNYLERVQSKLGLSSVEKVLAVIARYAKDQVNEKEVLCRFGEESFMLIVPQISPDDAETRADEFARHLAEHIVDVDGATLQFSYKIGVGLFSEMTTKSDTPISHALKALEILNQPDQAEKHTLVYEPEPDVSAENPTGMTQDELAKLLQKTIDQGKFHLLFQPILSLRGSEKEHYEVFMRLSDKKIGNIAPDNFLSVAQQYGLSTKIDRWVILESLKMLAKHRTSGHNTTLVINLTKDSLVDTSLCAWLNVAFKAAKLPPDSVIFQIQENHVNDHLNIAKEFTKNLRELGAGCCINRFGCHLDPFKALQHVAANYIKIDGSFTQELQMNSGEPSSLSDIVKQLHELEKITIVPFVESASVLSKLWQSGVHYIQGHYLQAPTDAMDYDFESEG